MADRIEKEKLLYISLPYDSKDAGITYIRGCGGLDQHDPACCRHRQQCYDIQNSMCVQHDESSSASCLEQRHFDRGDIQMILYFSQEVVSMSALTRRGLDLTIRPRGQRSRKVNDPSIAELTSSKNVNENEMERGLKEPALSRRSSCPARKEGNRKEKTLIDRKAVERP